MHHVKRRDFIALLGSTATIWPLAVWAQQPANMPVVTLVNARGTDASIALAAEFRKGLSQTGLTEGRDVAVEYHWLDGRYEDLPAIISEAVRRHVAVIATPASTPGSLAAKAATSATPIVFGVGEDPVALGLVASLSQPGGNATGINFFASEIDAKRLGLMHELLPKAKRLAVLVNHTNPITAEATTRALNDAAPGLGLQLLFFKASTAAEIDTAFAAFADARAEALFIAPDGFFANQHLQMARLATRDRIPASDFAKELRDQHCRCVPPSWRLCRQHPQRRQTGRSTSFASDQIRIHDQPASRAVAWHRCLAISPGTCRRGDRIRRRLPKLTFETCRRTPGMSVDWAGPEVAAVRSRRRF
jgi:putative ABC transport system substrate-binding protein